MGTSSPATHSTGVFIDIMNIVPSCIVGLTRLSCTHLDSIHSHGRTMGTRWVLMGDIPLVVLVNIKAEGARFDPVHERAVMKSMIWAMPCPLNGSDEEYDLGHALSTKRK